MVRFVQLACALLICTIVVPLSAEESFPPLVGGPPPQNVAELWQSYDPTAEPLDVQVVHEWQADGITTQLLTYHIGTFKGRPSRMGAYYACPTDAKAKLPAILQLHGGGQWAQRQTVETFAANGYACLALNWGALPMADQQPGDPGTDWGAVDATQTSHNSHYASVEPDGKTLDAVPSPRNNNWFLITVAARRALTLLEQRPEVDADRLGVTGHSMGGKLTVMTAGADRRVKAAVPSCGGSAAAQDALRQRSGSACRPPNRSPLYMNAIDDRNAIREIRCPILYLGPHNDFNGMVDQLFMNWKEMPSESIHFSISPHLNHRHVSESSYARTYFFDCLLKGEGEFPQTPVLEVNLKTDSGMPQATVRSDRPDEVVKVEVYYSVDPHGITRFWRSAEVTRSGDSWTAACPITSTELPLFVIANVHYPLDRKIVGGPGEGQPPATYLVSSWQLDFEADELVAAGVRATDPPERMIVEDFGDWQDWYQLNPGNPHHHLAATRKIKDPKWRGPDGAKLAIDVLAPTGGDLALTFELAAWSCYAGVPQGRYLAVKPLVAIDEWQTVEVSLKDLEPLDDRSRKGLASWRYLTELAITAAVRTRENGKEVIRAGGEWPADRQFRRLRWVGGTQPEHLLLPGAAISKADFEHIFQQSIDESVEQETRDAALVR
jgi:dienelactone hydrolase